MEVIKSIYLNEYEKNILERALGIIDHLADESKSTMDQVFDGLLGIVDNNGGYEYKMPSHINIDDL